MQARTHKDSAPQHAAEQTQAPQSLAERGNNRTQQPQNEVFHKFIGEDWGPRPTSAHRMAAADYTPTRRNALAAAFPEDCLIFPAGDMKVRSNDTDYRFRAHAAFSHLTGLGGEHEPGAVLVIYPAALAPNVNLNPESEAAPSAAHVTPKNEEEADKTVTAFLYFHPRASRSSKEFYADPKHGEFWVGARPSAEDMTTATGLPIRHIDLLRSDIDAAISKAAKGNSSVSEKSIPALVRIIPQADIAVENMVNDLRKQHNLPHQPIERIAGVELEETHRDAEISNNAETANAVSAHKERFQADLHTAAAKADNALAEAASELRLIKDAWEINEMRKAVAATKEGFENIIRSLPRAIQHWRGERVIEGAFGAKAREEGNGLGYDTIVGSGNHANTLHWINNDGQVREGDLVLVDAGVEMDSLYTADITRTLPVSGRFNETQRMVYQAVLDACEAALERANEKGARFKDVHEAAMQIIADRLAEWGLLPVSAEDSLKADGGQYHRRWMPHGTSHHLGIDVHDCAQAKRELYQEALLEPGMVFTIEPGLYFRSDDVKVPKRFRGIGVRIEDDVVVTEHGVERISQDIPRTVEAVEEWMADLLAEPERF